MLIRNPYLNRSMVRSLDGFFGRQREIERIMGRLGASPPQSVSVVGQRRIGKSSLLWQLAQPEMQGRYLDDPGRYLFVYLDFQGQRHLDLSGFSRVWSRQIAEAAGDRLDLEEVDDLSGLETQIARLDAAGLRLIGLFDEFETVTQSDAFGAEFFGVLRSLANQHPVAYVTASRRGLQDLCRSQEISESPFFNIFSRLQLGPLDADAAHELVCVPSAGTGAPLEPHATEILSLAGRLPLFLQIACSAATECLQENTGEFCHDALVRRFREEADGHLQYLWEHMRAEEQQTIRRLLTGEPLPAEQLTAETRAAVRTLREDGFIDGDGAGRPFCSILGQVVAEGIGDGTISHAAVQTAGPSTPPAAATEDAGDPGHVLDLEPLPEGASPFPGIIGRSEALRRVFAFIQHAAAADVTVLLLGQTGTGKELVARTIHDHGPRRKGPFVVVNCGAIAEHLQESELFGHRKGAFTDAHADREGLFEAAHGGTILLDEIGETTPATQVKLLRVLQEGEVRRVGETQPRKVDVRVLCATNRDLEAEVEAGRFREDLYYRLFVMVTRLPSLSERQQDIPVLSRHFLQGRDIDAEAMGLLVAYDWPGNIRELENQLAGAVAVAGTGPVQRQHLWPRLQRLQPVPVAADAGLDDLASTSPPSSSPDVSVDVTAPADSLSLRDARDAFERQLLQARMEQLGGEPTKVAQSLEISRSRLYELLRKYDLGR